MDINWMIREGIFDGSGCRSDTLRWTLRSTGQETASLGYEVNIPQRWIRLRYRSHRVDEDFDYKVPLTTSALPWGGVRWWFTCALTCDGRYCGRRVGKLYLPPGGRYYGCRHCYSLTYESCRDSHKGDRLFEMIGANLGISGRAVRATCQRPRNRDFERQKRNEQRRRRRKARNWA